MTAFWIAAGLLTALTLALLCWPLLRQRDQGQASRKAINSAIYRDQLAELEREHQAGALSDAECAQAREELERRILEDLREDAQPAAAPARRLPRSAIGLGLGLPVAAFALYFGAFGTPTGLDPKAQVQAQQGPTAAEVEAMVAKLAAKLEENPDNPKGWAMLGRSYKAMGRFDEAERAFGKAGSMIEQDPDIALDFIELSLQRNQGRIEGKAQALLKKLLAQDPDNLQALALAGTDAFYRERYADAIRHWEKLVAGLPPDSPDADEFNKGIAEARQRLGGTAKDAPASQAPAQGKAPEGTKADASASANAITGEVSLAPALKDKVAPGDTVYILARRATGPRMPLAVYRTQAGKLPTQFRLDDSMAMDPSTPLSQAGELRIEARISKSGDAMARPGDLSGELSPVKPGTQGLKLKIDKVIE
jgi:cytochrome c-type biogenesis protein CcmH